METDVKKNSICRILKNKNAMIVIYWSSTEPSIKRCTCVNKRKNSGRRWALNNNITRAQTAWVSWRQDAELRASGRQRALGPQWPTVKQPSQDEKEVLLGQYSSLSPTPAHLSYTTNINPFENKMCEIYFYKEVCSFVHWSSSLLLLMFRIYLYMHYVYVCGYTTYIIGSFSWEGCVSYRIYLKCLNLCYMLSYL